MFFFVSQATPALHDAMMLSNESFKVTFLRLLGMLQMDAAFMLHSTRFFFSLFSRNLGIIPATHRYFSHGKSTEREENFAVAFIDCQFWLLFITLFHGGCEKAGGEAANLWFFSCSIVEDICVMIYTPEVLWHTPTSAIYLVREWKNEKKNLIKIIYMANEVTFVSILSQVKLYRNPVGMNYCRKGEEAVGKQ